MELERKVLTPGQEIDLYQKGDKDVTDLFRLVKNINLDDPDFFQDEFKDSQDLRKYAPSFYRRLLGEYYDAQDKLNLVEMEKDTLSGKEYRKQPGSRGASKSDFEAMDRLVERNKEEAKAEKEAQAVIDAEQNRKDNLGFFGKMMETLKTDADARQKFFDQLGSIGAEISRPTDPGEARSLVRDVIVGSEKGEGKTIAKRKASAEALADAALAQQRANPMQYYTTAMKELTQQAISEGFQPGTLAFTKYVGAKLRDKGISEQALTYSEVLKNLNEQLMTAQATGEQERVDQILQQISQTQNLLNTVLGGTSTGASNVVAYKPQN